MPRPERIEYEDAYYHVMNRGRDRGRVKIFESSEYYETFLTTLEEAVEKLTSRAADIYRIKDRGRLQVGAWADLMLFDPNTVGRGEKRRVQDLPAGATRVDTPAVGLHGVWVNGVRTVDDAGENVADCGKPGQLLRDFADLS